MLGIRCVGVCGCQSENSFVYFGAKPTQRACARDLSRNWKDEERKVREKRRDQSPVRIEESQQKGAEENSRLEIEVQRRTQSEEGGSENMEAGQRRQSTEVRKTTAKTY